MNDLIQIILLNLAPISELRGGIPLALAYGYSPFFSFLLCTIANILVVPIVFIFLETINKLFLKIPAYSRFFHKTLERSRKKIHEKVEKYGYFGLMLFVAVPLPVTGAYTGTLGAWALGMSKKRAFAYISLGVILAGVIVTLVAYYGIQALSFLIK
ncbi:MAG: small multi-drug export protein [archaeon]|jgi:uncharacterized membrane protein|nr:small multi-drug export protein [archaeon]